MKEPAPANFARMNQGIGVDRDAIENRTGTPGFARRINGHVNHHGCTDDMVARNTANEAAVERIFAIVPHKKQTVLGNRIGKQSGFADGLLNERQRRARFGAADSVIFVQDVSVDVDMAVVHINRLARKANDALDDVGGIPGDYWAENHDLLTLRISP